MKKFYIVGILVLIAIVCVFNFVGGKEEKFEEVYMEENSLGEQTIQPVVDKIKIHIVGEVESPRNL